MQEANSDQGIEDITGTFALPLELIPPSPALKLPHMSPSSLEGFAHSKSVASGPLSIHSLDVLQEQDGLESNGAFWNGESDHTEGEL